MRLSANETLNELPALDVVTEMCERLLREGAPSLHFYTLNQAGLVSTICQRLGY